MMHVETRSSSNNMGQNRVVVGYRRMSTTPPTPRQQESPYRRSVSETMTNQHEHSAGIPLEDFVLTRLPTVRNVSGQTDDSPSSVLVHPELPSKQKLIHLQEQKEMAVLQQNSSGSGSWNSSGKGSRVPSISKQSPQHSSPVTLSSNATAVTWISRDSSSQQSNHTNVNVIKHLPQHSTPATAATWTSRDSLSQYSSCSRQNAYSKPADDKPAPQRQRRRLDAAPPPPPPPTRKSEAQLNMSSSSLFNTLNIEIRAENEDDSSSNNPDDSNSSAALDAFLDSRLMSLLDETGSEDKIKGGLLAGGTKDHPVDLTQYFSSPVGTTDNSKEEHGNRCRYQQHHADEHKSSLTPPQPTRKALAPPSNLSARQSLRRPSPPPPTPSEPQEHVTPRRKRPSPPRLSFPASRRIVSDSSGSNRPRERTPPPQRQEQQQSSSSASFFNPLLSGFSPSKQGEQSSSLFMGGIFYHSKTSMTLAEGNQPRLPQNGDPHQQYDDDASSVDSETLLEMLASQIRAELRHKAMVEMALEAERAAEAGEEKFSSTRPWIYGDESDPEEDPPHGRGRYQFRRPHSSTLSPMMKSYQMLRRNASYTEGCTPVLRRASSIAVPRSSLLPLPRRIVEPPKIEYCDLRDVNEVFPSFDIFHKNLRTHLARNNVKEQCLIFEEIDPQVAAADANIRGICSTIVRNKRHIENSTRTLSAALQESSTSSFLDSFSFDLLGGAAGVMVVKIPSSECNEDDTMGDLLAEHLYSELKSRRLPKRETLPGLEDLSNVQILANPTSPSSKPPPLSSYLYQHRRSGSHLFSTPKQQPRLGQLREEGPAPRALFDSEEAQTLSDVDYSFDETGESSILSRTPLVESSSLTDHTGTSTNKSGIFVTPARLRRIRGKDGSPSPASCSIPLPLLAQNEKDAAAVAAAGDRSVSSTPPRARDTMTPRALLMPTLPSMGSFDDYDRSRTANIMPSVSPNGRWLRAYSPNADSILDSEEQRRNSHHQRPWQRRHLFTSKSRVTQSYTTPQGLLPLLQEAEDQGTVLEGSTSFEHVDDGSCKNEKEITTPALQDCQCLSLSSDSFDEVAMPESMDAQELQQSSSSNPKSAASQHNANSPEPFVTAMKMFSQLSPKSCAPTSQLKKKKSRRSLYVGLQENDDFMQNFLYCGKRTETVSSNNRSRSQRICTEPCENDGCDADGVTAAANQCYAAFILNQHSYEPTTPEFSFGSPTCGPMLISGGIQTSGRRRNSLFLSQTEGGKPRKTEPETWFDVATEKVDGVIESLIGTTPQNRWNLSFQPPSLRKVKSSSTTSDRQWIGVGNLGATGPIIEENTTIDASQSPSNSSVSVPAPRPSTPVSFFAENKNHDLSDDQFHLIYGMTREEHQGRQADDETSLRSSQSMGNVSAIRPRDHRTQKSMVYGSAHSLTRATRKVKPESSNTLVALEMKKSY